MKGETILLIGYSHWSMWRPTHDLAYLFAKDNRVILVEHLWGYEYLRWLGEGRLGYLRRFLSRRVEWINENLAVVRTIPALPAYLPLLSRWFDRGIRRLSLRASKALQIVCLRRQLHHLGISPTVLFISHPFDLLLAGRFGERVACWYVYDEMVLGEAPSARGDVINETERDNIKRVDLVFASSRTQFENRKKLHPRVFCVLNAVNFERFHAALVSDIPEPADLRGIPRPRIGYIGTFTDRLDYELLLKMIKTHPEWSLVMVGWLNEFGRAGMEKLAALPNVHVLGAKSQAELPAYVKAFDLGLIPFRLTPRFNSMCPLKMFEYLAAGLPVVSTDLDEVRPFSSVVGLARDTAEFMAMVGRELATNSRAKVEARVAVARENSWERRVEEMGILIDEVLENGP